MFKDNSKSKGILLKIFFIYALDLLSFTFDYSFLYQNEKVANVLGWIDPAYTVQFFVIGIIGCVFLCKQSFKEFSGNILNPESLMLLIVNILFVVGITQIGAFVGEYEVNWIGVLNRSVYCLIFIGITEEWIYRGFIVTQFEKVLAKRISIIVISAVLFSLMHLPSFLLHTEDISILSLGYRLLIPFLMGVAFAAIYLWKNNLLVLIVIHGVYDLIECVAFDSWYFIAYGIYWVLILGYMLYCSKTKIQGGRYEKQN